MRGYFFERGQSLHHFQQAGTTQINHAFFVRHIHNIYFSTVIHDNPLHFFGNRHHLIYPGTAFVPLAPATVAANGTVHRPILSQVFFSKPRFKQGRFGRPLHRRFALRTQTAQQTLGDLNKYPTELSGGMAKRVAFLRLLLCGCDLALLDEPFVGLDRDLRDILAAMLVEKIEQQGMACILVTHDRFEAARLSREIMQLSPKGMDVQNVITLPTPLSERNSAFEETVVAREFQGIHYYE